MNLRRGRWLWLVLAFVVVVAGAFVVWGITPSQPMPQALAALVTDTDVQVTEVRWLVFAPLQAAPTKGFIIYPGGHVDARAYAPTARALAAEGTLVVIVKMPLSLAVLASDSASQVVAAYPQIKTWAIGGHSLGGAMAAFFVYNHPDVMHGLVLWAAYPANSASLADSSVSVISMYGTFDGLAAEFITGSSRALLPANTTWLQIDGGNHAQFGWYGAQAGDGVATISREAQQSQVVQATAQFLAGLVQ
ncbi:MAG: alpha/beta hydrolase [Anaerolineae bacterium]